MTQIIQSPKAVDFSYILEQMYNKSLVTKANGKVYACRHSKLLIMYDFDSLDISQKAIRKEVPSNKDDQ